LYNYIEGIFIKESINTINIDVLKLKIQYDTSLIDNDRVTLISTLTDVVSYLSLDTNIDLSFKDNYIQKYREEFKKNYLDLNVYYLNLQTTYGLDIIQIRNAQNFELLYVNPRLINSSTALFQTYYNIVRNVFISTLFNKAFSKDMIVANENGYMNYYNSYCKFMIVLMTIIEIIQRNLSIPIDANVLDDDILDQFLYSFGFPDFKHFPSQYKRNVVANLNRLIQYKGTDQVLVDILGIFDLNDINIFRYYLVKYSTTNKGKTFFPDVDLRFIATPVSTNINDALKLDNVSTQSYKVVNYEDVTDIDPTWKATKQEILSKEFDIINTKYISVDVSVDLIKDTYNFVYIQNSIRKFKTDFPNSLDLKVFSSKLSESQIEIEHIFLLLHVMILDYYNIEDYIDFSQNKILNIYQFNTSNDKKYESSVLKKDSFLQSLFDLAEVDSHTYIDKNKFESIFLKNKIANENYIKYINAFQTKQIKFKELQDRYNLYRSKFYSKLNLDMYSGFTKYSDYLKYENPDLYKYFQNSLNQNSDDKVASILTVLDILIEYYKNLKLNVNSIIYNEISKYIVQTINIFKSHLVTLDKLSLRYKVDESTFFKLIDEIYFKAHLRYTAILDIEDYKIFKGYIKKYNKLSLLDRIRTIDYIPIRTYCKIKDISILKSKLIESNNALLPIEDDMSIADHIRNHDNLSLLDYWIYNNIYISTRTDCKIKDINIIKSELTRYIEDINIKDRIAPIDHIRNHDNLSLLDYRIHNTIYTSTRTDCKIKDTNIIKSTSLKSNSSLPIEDDIHLNAIESINNKLAINDTYKIYTT
jgi:hypothetical protein